MLSSSGLPIRHWRYRQQDRALRGCNPRKHYGIPFYVAAPSSTFDLATKHGSDIEIEQRDGEEVVNGFGRRTGPVDVQVYNPAFDVTDAAFITAIITEKGIIKNPTTEKVAKHLRG